jgi:hypothetical protein
LAGEEVTTMPKNPDHVSTESPTLPLPPPRAQAISLDNFFEAASAAAIRSLEAHARQAGPHPEPWHIPPRIWVGIIIETPFPQQLANPGELSQGRKA